MPYPLAILLAHARPTTSLSRLSAFTARGGCVAGRALPRARKPLPGAGFGARDVEFASRNGRGSVELVSRKCRDNVESM
jgi:hypothetical protein